jgi:pyruvate dehydrogenase phosphatase
MQRPFNEREHHNPLSIDQISFDKYEVAKVQAEHSGKESVVNEKNGRTLGMVPSRSFGDRMWKWPNEVGKELYALWPFNPRDEKVCLTPPYLNTELTITTIRLREECVYNSRD